MVGGRRRLTPTGRTAQTNDLGQFRMYGLPPGEYYVSATLRNMDVDDVRRRMSAAATSGASGSHAGVRLCAHLLPRHDRRGRARRASPWRIGQEAQNTDFALVPVRLARITGIVMTSEGKPVEGAHGDGDPVEPRRRDRHGDA